MIIVSQSKKMVVNFGISQILEVNTPEAWGQGFYSIDTYPNTEDSQKFHIRLGKYDTEKRAKEVLEEIIEMYCQCNNNYSGYVGNRVYKMPKE